MRSPAETFAIVNAFAPLWLTAFAEPRYAPNTAADFGMSRRCKKLALKNKRKRGGKTARKRKGGKP